MASTWLDISSLYGSTPDVANLLRSHQDGKLLTQEVQAPGTKSKASYLPFNTMHVPTNTRPGVDDDTLFGGEVKAIEGSVAICDVGHLRLGSETAPELCTSVRTPYVSEYHAADTYP